MEPERLSSLLLSGAATDLEAVVDARDDLHGDEVQELSELVARIRDLNERLSYSSEVRDLPDRVELLDRLETILRDDRYHYDSANVEVNAVLALIQTEKSAQARTLAWVVGEEIPGQGDLQPGEWDGFEEVE